MAAPSNQLFVGAANPDQPLQDPRDDTGRLKSSGMNRDREDKNPVNDDFDYGNLRENLGKGGKKPVQTDSERVQQAAAGKEPGTAKFSNQLTVADGRELKPVDEDPRDAKGRLRSSGMDRDRTDRNPVNDDFDFASLRANLGRKKAASNAGSVSSGAGTAAPPPASPPQAPPPQAPPPQAPPSAVPSEKKPEKPPTPTQFSPPTIVEPTPQGTPKGTPKNASLAQPPLSRKASTASVLPPKSPLKPTESPAPSNSSPPSAQSPSQAEPSPTKSPSIAASRQGSQQSLRGRPPTPPQQSSVAAPSPEQASAAPLSRQGSRASTTPTVQGAVLSRQGSQVSEGRVPSRQPSVQSVRTPLVAESSPPPPPPPVEDEFAGVDWKLTCDHLKSKLREMESAVRDRDRDLAAAQARADELSREKEAISQQLSSAGRRGSKGPCHSCEHLRSQLESSKQNVSRLEKEVADNAKLIATLKEQADGVKRRSSNPDPHGLLESARQEAVMLRSQAEQREQLIQKLSHQLEAAHEAMIAATQMGFEHDVKLHQARSALVALMKKEKEKQSPRRDAYASPRGGSTSPEIQKRQIGGSPVFEHQDPYAGSPSRYHQSPPAYQTSPHQHQSPQQHYQSPHQHYQSPQQHYQSPQQYSPTHRHPSGSGSPVHGHGHFHLS